MNSLKRKALLGAMLVFFYIAFSIPAYAAEPQEKVFTFEMHDVALQAVFNHIEKNSDYVFLYSTNKSILKKVDINIHEKSLKQILDELLTNTGLTYEIDGKQVIVNLSKNQPTSKKRANNKMKKRK